MQFPDPVILEIYGPIAIRWYSMSYIVGIILSVFYAKRLIKDRFVTGIGSADIDDFLSYAIIGIILGGRLGYVLIYDIGYYINDPLEIIKTYNGGMSFHGGAIGMLLAGALYTHLRNISFYKFMDLICIIAPITIFFVRIANFINQELYGRTTDFFLSVIFPRVDSLSRHPSQLYEAFFEGAILFVILDYINKKRICKPGQIGALFVTIYSIFRFILEFTRQPDEHIGYIFSCCTAGQLLSLAGIFIGSCIFIYRDIGK